jgi:hypothetical protein
LQLGNLPLDCCCPLTIFLLDLTRILELSPQCDLFLITLLDDGLRHIQSVLQLRTALLRLPEFLR